MRLVLCALSATVIATSLPIVASAQTMNLMEAAKKIRTDEDVKQEEERNRAYQNAMKKLPDQNTAKADPWGTVRSGGTQAAQTKPTKPKSDPK
jgi:hypothetical protein